MGSQPWAVIDFGLSLPRWRVRRPPPVAALGCCRAMHPPSVLRTICERAILAQANGCGHRQPLSQAACCPPITDSLKPARVGVRADDIGAKRGEEARIPRDGGFRGGVQTTHTPKWRLVRGSSKQPLPKLQIKKERSAQYAPRHRLPDLDAIHRRRQNAARKTRPFARRVQAAQVGALVVGVALDAQRR